MLTAKSKAQLLALLGSSVMRDPGVLDALAIAARRELSQADRTNLFALLPIANSAQAVPELTELLTDIQAN